MNFFDNNNIIYTALIPEIGVGGNRIGYMVTDKNRNHRYMNCEIFIFSDINDIKLMDDTDVVYKIRYDYCNMGKRILELDGIKMISILSCSIIEPIESSKKIWGFDYEY